MPIFETITSTTKAVDRNLISFKDCPNQCKNGKIFDFINHTEGICPYCADKRKSMVIDGVKEEDYGDINKVLSLPPNFRGYRTDVDELFSEIEKTDKTEYTNESMTKAKNDINELLQLATLGEIPKYSVAIQLPHLFAEYDFIATYLLRSYLSGLITAPLLDIPKLRKIRDRAEKGLDGQDEIKFDYLLEADTVVVYVDNGVSSTIGGLDAVYGFTNLRSLRLKPTVIVCKTRILKAKPEDFEVNPNYKLYKVIQLEKAKKTSENKTTNVKDNVAKTRLMM